jgi:CRISPR/Cas system-associated exonuclease Cas4 (RecB family)
MAKNPYKDLLKMVNKATADKPFQEQFVDDIDKYFQLSKEKYTPSKSIKPSSLGGCLRNQYFILTGAPMDVGKLEQASMVTIQQSGNDRHERIQYACQDACNYNIPITWLDPVDECTKAQSMGINTIVKRRDGNEVLCWNSDYEASFKCDGIILYKGIKMILEIKTEDHFKWLSRVAPEPAHEYQAMFYSLLFGIDKVMFLYENRNLTTRKAYFVDVSQEQRDKVKDRILTVQTYRNNKIIPPKDENKNKCTYCNYKVECRRYGKEEYKLEGDK